MNRDDIIRIAMEAGAGLSTSVITHERSWVFLPDDLERFFQAAYAAGADAEREACAKVCDKGVDTEHPTVKGHIMRNFGASSLLAAAIRARGETK